MGLFTISQIDKINETAAKSKAVLKPPKAKSSSKFNSLDTVIKEVKDYFADSKAIIIRDRETLHEYVTGIINAGIAGIDTETTGLDKMHDEIVGASLYYPGAEAECYIPLRHRQRIFDDICKNQLTYEDVKEEFNRITNTDTKLIFANADFDLSMIYWNFNVDFCKNFYYDVILAWRCLKEDERDNSLKGLYNKYVLKGKGDPKKFSDFFSVDIFPYCPPEVAGLYAGNDAKITYELYKWQLPYVTKGNPKCEKKNLGAIADIIWNLEFPLVKVCQDMHRTGIQIDNNVAKKLKARYNEKYDRALAELQNMVQDALDNCTKPLPSTRQFTKGEDFNPRSTLHVKFLLKDVLGIIDEKTSTGKEVLGELNHPIASQILKVRSLSTLINTFVDKLPELSANSKDGRIHPSFKQLGARTGRISSEDPNAQNIPAKADDIRHMFRATSAKKEYVDAEKEPAEINDVETDSTETNKNIFKITLSKYDSLYDENNKEQKIYNLSCGEKTKVKNGKEDLLAEIISIKNIKESPNAEIKLQIDFLTDNFSNIKIPVKTASYAMLSSDYSQQEPRLTAFLGNDEKMSKAFKEGKDIYASIASVAFNLPYEQCLEFNPDTGEYQADGKKRRSEAKTILLGVTYGRSVPSIAEQLYGNRTDMTDDEKIKSAQKVYDAVINSFSGLKNLMEYSERFAKKYGYVETMLGRRRHIPEMKLPRFEFKAMSNYVNPDIDPLDVSTLENTSEIPERIVEELSKELNGYKYFGQVARRMKELYEQGIKVINNGPKIAEASRKLVNSRVQGSAADLTKMAMLALSRNKEWKSIGGRLLIPVHDELIAEVPMEEYEKGGKLLSKIMKNAASFLPFGINCDVTISVHWYGLEYPCEYKKPESIYTENEDEVKWIQYYLFECEYDLPIIQNEDGTDLMGDAAHGVNGKISKGYKEQIIRYLKDFSITENEFINHIEQTVKYGYFDRNIA